MRQSHASLALVRRADGDRTRYLTQWNDGWKALNFPGGHREAGESFLDCIRRELNEELAIDPDEDCHIDPTPRRLEYVAFSKSSGQETAYVIELFDVELTPDALERIDLDPLNAWISLDEVHSGRTAGSPGADGKLFPGRAISPTVLLLLDKAGLLG